MGIDRKVMVSLWFRGRSEEVKHELHYLRDYSDHLERFLAERFNAFKERIKTEAKKLSNEARDDFYEWHSDEYLELSEELPNRLRGSLFVTVMFILEHRLNEFCVMCQKASGSRLVLNDMADKGIYRARKYLNKVFEINFPDSPAFWEKIDIFQIIRNAIAHNDGNVNQEVDKLNDYISKMESASFKLESSKILLNDSFVTEAIDLIQGCLVSLYKQLDKNITKDAVS